MASTDTILIVDDEQRIRDTLSDILKVKGYNTVTAGSGEEALKLIREKLISAVLLDVILPRMNGMEVMRKIQELNPAVPVLLITAYATVPLAVEAIKQGAYDFVEKPFDADKLLVLLQNAIARYKLYQENSQLRQALLERYEMIGVSQAMKQVFKRVELLAPKDCTVLITGETGTGKLLVARCLHALSNRVNGPFVRINCAALPAELFENELFGHARGAYTGANKDEVGKFEAASGGTLFLDECGDIPSSAQAKLLQVLEDKSFSRLGEVEERTCDVRIIAATNHDLEEAIRNKSYRMDLYYRLRTTSIYIPPLRERPEDIEELVLYYTPKICEDMGIRVKRIDPKAMSYFLNYPWPGNVRELRHKLQEMLIFHEGDELKPDYVAQWFKEEPSPAGQENGSVPKGNHLSLSQAREDFERRYILQVLHEEKWNIPAAAERLGIERSNLYRKMKQLKIRNNAGG